LSYPLVTAIMPTYRECFARYAIKLFKEQSYPNKELIIVNQGFFSLRRFIRNDCSIKEVQVSPYANVGAMYNVGLDYAQGEYIVRVDDDDWYHPDRIKLQVQALRTGHWIACTFNRRIHYSIPLDVAVSSVRVSTNLRPFAFVGVVLFKRQLGQRFLEHVDKGSDYLFTQQYCKGKLRTISLPEWYYIRTHHAENLWDAEHILGIFAYAHPGSRFVDPESRGPFRKALQEFKRGLRSCGYRVRKRQA